MHPLRPSNPDLSSSDDEGDPEAGSRREGGQDVVRTVVDRGRDEERLIHGGCLRWSFEYFPPRTSDGFKNLFDRIERMRSLGPEFIDITWSVVPPGGKRGSDG